MEITKFAGIKNTTAQERLNPGDFSAAKNVDLDDTGKVRTRGGFEQLHHGVVHSIWSQGELCLFVENAVLYRLSTDLATITPLATLQSNQPMSYTSFDEEDRVFCSNYVDSLYVWYGKALPWGLPVPETPEAAYVDGGSLAEGTYHYAMTFVDGEGFESGASLAGVVDVQKAGAIEFSRLPTSTSERVRGKILYLSSVGGEVLYRTPKLIGLDVTSYLYRNNGSDLLTPLRTEFCFPPPAGDIVESWNGITFVVDGDVVWHSLPYLPELFRRATDFLPFPGQVQLFCAVDDGIYVATETLTWFLSGASPSKFTAREVFPYGAIKGTVARDEAALFGGGEGKAAIWASPRGICVGMNGGSAKNLTEKSFSFPDAARGAGVVRKVNGYSQFLTVLQGEGVPFNAAS